METPSANFATPAASAAGHRHQIWMIDEIDLFHMLEERGRQCYSEKFSLWEEDFLTLRKLLSYFLGDAGMAERLGLDMHKGIMLSGPVGCGKSSIMDLMRCFMETTQQYSMKPCRDVVLEFHSTGFEVLNQYSKKSFQKANGRVLPKVHCFDDLGAEAKAFYYGNECDVMREVVLSRYELFESHRMLTHFTTNLTEKELEKRYGENVFSRLCAMANFIRFESTTLDKRRHSKP